MVRQAGFGIDPSSEETLRINIDGSWRATEFSRLFSEFETLNELASFGQVRIDGQSDLRLWPMRRPRSRYYDWYWTEFGSEQELEDEFESARVRVFLRRFAPRRPLIVKEIKFASPGHTDLGGLAGIMREIRLFVMDIADRFIAAPDRALAREDKHQSIMTKKLANAERLLKLSNKVDLDPALQRDLIRRTLETDRYIEDKIIDREITSFE
jgi:hypothetical protein